MIRRPLHSILFPYPTLFFFFFNDTATTEIYTLSLHDALPILDLAGLKRAISSHLFLLSDERQLQWSMPQVKKLTDTTVARLRAFGVLGRALKGGVAVTRASSTFQREALIFAAHLHYLSGGHNHNLLGSPYFRGLGLGDEGSVEHALVYNQSSHGATERVLRYRAQGGIRELDLSPVPAA